MPNAFSDVNFIPDEVVSDRKHVSQVKSLNQFAIIAMIVSLLLGGGLFGYNFYSKNKIVTINNEVNDQQSQIEQLNSFAESGYKLGLRLASIKQILSNRPYYGKVIEELYDQVPGSVTIDTLQISDSGAVILTGQAYPNYIPIASLQDNLKNSEKGYFSDIRLRSAALNKTTGSVNFTLEFIINLSKIHEPI